jgi:hypothetical protein
MPRRPERKANVRPSAMSLVASNLHCVGNSGAVHVLTNQVIE